ncbi:helix-turn-helix, psq domain-containing protein [Hirsutella rhossiliensis]|uniref:Helix-turn-helix, psq domain-containing protein n=1 Tax=Hirsutella rhossiliensis TaxID=111463 RepID=A0A9P8N5A9_9HYPO|nr:helix-turn-helix, psq domain-containing protein [Hirsutella rhossiliensis]KAH0967200.1 helix-turn-helix, psq domain-containing protein [Hirsutella rhossiliensis]
MTATGDQSVPREERVLLAVRAYQQGQFESTRKAAAAYDVPQSTVSDRLRGVIRRRDAQVNNLKLTATEETALVQWILSMDERGMPPTMAYTRRMANCGEGVIVEKKVRTS